MSSETEFACWLRRPEKTFLENFRFALKAWQSAEFTLPNKYELVLSWLSEQAAYLSEGHIPFAELIELLKLRAQPGLIDQQIKCSFVETMLTFVELKAQEQPDDAYTLTKLLKNLSEYELLQDLYRTDYELHARVFGTLLKSYELHLQQFNVADASQTSKMNVTTESEFFSCIINALNNNVKRTGDGEQYDRSYCQHTLQPLAKVLLVLRSHGMCFFDEFLQLERLLTEQYEDLKLVKRMITMPMYVRLLTFECAIVNRRGVEGFLRILLQRVFDNLPTTIKAQPKRVTTPYALTAIAYILEMLRKHDINLNFSISIDDPQPVLTYLGAHLLPYVQQFKEQHLREVLLLLCAALRLNPLILEQDIFQVTTWMIVAVKNNSEEQELFEEFLASLMDMFRRLSRAEKLVFNLLKTLKEWLNQFELVTPSKRDNKTKRKANTDDGTPAKKPKQTIVAENNETDFYLRIIFAEFHKPATNTNMLNVSANTNCSFPYLRSAWPSATVGVAFSKLVTGLVSKPSLVIWKSLLYSLKELLEMLQQTAQGTTKENSLFLLDLHSALLCQYFNGCRLAEQWDKYSVNVTEQCRFTTDVLKQFGRYLQTQEYQKRAMNAFLECSYNFANFQLLLSYYLPDGYESTNTITADRLHAFLTVEEWALLQQRVLNFGKSNCRFLFDRLMLQRAEAQTILQSDEANIDIQKTLQSTAKQISQEDVGLLLQQVPSAHWFVTHLSDETKTDLIQQLLEKPELIVHLTDELESLEVLAAAVYMKLCDLFKAASKGSMLSALNYDFTTLRQHMSADTNTSDKQLQKLIAVIEQHAQSEYKLKKPPNTENIQAIMGLLRLLPIGHLRRQSKNYLFALHLAFFSDLKAAALESNDLEEAAFDMLTDILHFGQHVPVFKYFNAATILRILPGSNCWPFYEYVFATIKREEKGTEQFLTSLAEIVEATQQADGTLADDQRRLVMLAIETLAAISGPSAKRLRKYFDHILTIYAKHVNAHFDKQETTKSPAGGGSSKKDRKFVEKTLAGFAPYANALLNKATAAAGNTNEPATAIDENFRRICKIYIGHSMDYRNLHAVRLMQTALTHRLLLHLDQDEIEFVLNHYWQQLKADLKSHDNTAQAIKTTETAVKIIIGNKTNEDLLLTLQQLGTDIDDEKDYRHILQCLELIAKCSFSTIKGAIFNEKFKDITYNIVLRLAKDEQQQFIDKQQVLAVLAAQKSLIENKMIPISMDTLDDILAFLMDINIKKLPLSAGNLLCFKELHLAMSDLLGALIRQRHQLLMDRVAQFMHIFKDLLQAIVWYKCERQKDSALSTSELDDLTELALKMEALMHLIAAHSVHVKRIAPFVLTFAINLMVGNKRATTLYPKIKTHVDNICYDLIGICDYHVGRFILRCSNEAARQVYELMVKDHNKYHKFKGKV